MFTLIRLPEAKAEEDDKLNHSPIQERKEVQQTQNRHHADVDFPHDFTLVNVWEHFLCGPNLEGCFLLPQLITGRRAITWRV